MKIITQIIQNISKAQEFTPDQKDKILEKLNDLKNQKVNILIIGGTGVGKSSTINAIFKGNVAPVGTKANPETMEITNFKIDENITIWDSPGLGDGIKDKQHKEKIFNLLDRKDDKDNRLIDCVLVVISANSKDLGTTYELINNVLIKQLGHDEAQEKLIIGINKSDEAIHSRYWDNKNHHPSKEQIGFLDGKVEDIKTRIFESTNVQLDPIYYVAGYNDENFSDPSWNIDKLMIKLLESVKDKSTTVFEDFDLDGLVDGASEVVNTAMKLTEKTINKLIIPIAEGSVNIVSNGVKKVFGYFGKFFS